MAHSVLDDVLDGDGRRPEIADVVAAADFVAVSMLSMRHSRTPAGGLSSPVPVLVARLVTPPGATRFARSATRSVALRTTVCPTVGTSRC